MSTGNDWTEIFLDRSKSTLILGENGAGKSTFIEAIVYALYGKPYRNINKPLLINSITGKGLVVEVSFSIGSKRYLVRRGAKPSIFEIFCNGVLLPQNADAREYQESLELNILKMNHRTFCQVVVLGTANFTPFMQLAAHNRRGVVEDLLDIQIFSKMFNLLKDRISQNKNDISENTYSIKLLTERIKMYKVNMANIKQNTSDIINSKISIVNDLITEIDEFDTEISLIESNIEQLKLGVTDYKSTNDNHSKYISAKNDLISKKREHLEHIDFFHDNDTCPTCTQSIEPTFKEDYIEKRKDRIDSLDKATSELTTMIEQTQSKLDELQAILSDISSKERVKDTASIKRSAVMRSIKSYRNEIEDLKTKTKSSEVDAQGLINLQDESKALEVEREELAKKKQTYELASVMLKDGGIKTKIIKQYIPVINKLVNKYLAAMDFFINFELNEKFEEVIKSRFRDEFSYNSFSEGEKMRIDLSLLFTWRSVAKLRNSASTNLLIMDEVFDSSLDNNGTEEFLKIIETMAPDTNIFVISHKADNLYDKFHSSIRFQKTKNFSKMV